MDISGLCGMEGLGIKMQEDPIGSLCGVKSNRQPGRWHQGEDGREADWPCTAVTFDVQARLYFIIFLTWFEIEPACFKLRESSMNYFHCQ